MVRVDGKPKETQEKLACQDSAVTSSDPPAALPGHVKPLLSPNVNTEPHFGVKMEHMLTPFSISSLLLKIGGGALFYPNSHSSARDLSTHSLGKLV